MNATVRICAFIILASAALPLAAAEPDSPPWLRAEANLYPWQRDVKNDTDFTLVVNARLPARFSYFSYVNIRGVVTSGDAEFVRSEQNLRWGVSDKLPIDPGHDILRDYMDIMRANDRPIVRHWDRE